MGRNEYNGLSTLFNAVNWFNFARIHSFEKFSEHGDGMSVAVKTWNIWTS
jgi:hypothetical protein